jgi:hypothetical protein
MFDGEIVPEHKSEVSDVYGRPERIYQEDEWL